MSSAGSRSPIIFKQNDVIKFLSEVTRNDTENPTHIVHLPEKKKISVDPTKWDKFWKGICDMASNPNNETIVEELPGGYVPIIAKLRLTFNSKPGDELYTDQFLHSLAYCYQQAIKELYTLSKKGEDTGMQLLCVVLESEPWKITNPNGSSSPQYDEKTGITAVDITLHFPFTKVEPSHQNKVLRPRVIALLQQHNVVSYCSPTPINQWDTIINPESVSGSILMYGSPPNKGEPRVEFKKIFEELTDDVFEDDKEISELTTLSGVFEPNNHSLVSQGLLDANIFFPKGNAPDLSEEELRYWLPLFLSVGFWDKPTLAKKGPTPVARFNHRNQDSFIQRYAEGQVANLETAELLLDMMNSEKRFGNTCYWLAIGRALIGCAVDDKQDTEKAFNIWMKHTAKHTKYTPEECRYRASKFPANNLTIKTLAWYAREDNSEAYNEWHKMWCEGAMCKAISLTHTDVARAINRFYWLEYICGDNINSWHEFRDNRWVSIGDGLFLRKKISDNFVRKCEVIRASQTARQKDCNDDKQREELEKYVKGFTALISKLKNAGYKTSLIKECREFFYHEDATKLMDTDALTMGTADGVIECVDETPMPNGWNSVSGCGSDSSCYDLKLSGTKSPAVKNRGDAKYSSPKLGSISESKEEYAWDDDNYKEVQRDQVKRVGVAVFRSGKPEDFISKATQIKYKQDGRFLHWGHPLVKELMNWLRKTFPNRALCEYFIKFAASCIRGRNSDKIFPVFTGEGNNSKSMIIKLFEVTFGSYCIKFPTSLFTGKRGMSSGPSPEIARAKSAKVTVAQEPGPDEQLQGGPIKELTGGDSFFARLLHDNGGDVTPLFKCIFMCNAVPIIPNADKAIENRMKLFPFLAQWAKDAPADEKEQWARLIFRMDPFFEERIPFLGSAFLWVLTQYYPKYVAGGLGDVPDIVKKYTDKYWMDNDPYVSFIAETFVQAYMPDGRTVDVSQVVTGTNAYIAFKAWWRDNCPNAKVPDARVVKAQLQDKRRFGPIIGNNRGWLGIKMIESDGVNVGRGAGSGQKVGNSVAKSLGAK